MSARGRVEVQNLRQYFGKLSEGVFTHDFYDKGRVIENQINYMLLRTSKMFDWKNLPETIPQVYLERFLQVSGVCAIAPVKGSLYAFTGGVGGPPDPYYQPTLFTVANPGLEYSATLKIGVDCALVRGDSLYMGLMPMFNKYSAILCENELSFLRALVSCRQTALISASDDRTYQSAIKYLTDIEAGKPGVVSEPQFFDTIKAQPLTSVQSNNSIGALIESEQFWLGRWYAEVGIQAPFNMKREALNSAETLLDEDQLFPLIDEMLRCRQEGAEEINRLYGTNISVSLSSVWEENRDEKSKRLDSDPEQEIGGGENANSSGVADD